MVAAVVDGMGREEKAVAEELAVAAKMAEEKPLPWPY